MESQRWLHVLESARAVGATYKCPNCKDIGGELLEVNSRNYRIHNLAEATKGADIFSLSMLGDEVTIKKMALFNVMVLNGNLHPVFAAIKYCTGHLSKAGKKDALFIADAFNNLLLEFDAEKDRVEIFILTTRRMCRRPDPF